MATINSAPAAVSPASSTTAGLVPAAHGTAKRHAEQVTLARSEAPAPGQFWRPRADLPGRHDKRGQHNALKAGTLLLVTKIDLADGVMHSVQLAPHPSWGKYDHGCHIHIDDFEMQWENVPDAEADAIRAAEMAGITTAMAETQQALIQGPPPDEVTGFARLAHTPAANAGDSTALATSEGLRSLTDHADALQREAKRTEQWISAHSATLGTHAGTLARYHGERGVAALARAQTALDSAARIRETVKSLEIYVGADVAVLSLREGVPAAHDAPLTIYQDVLSFDEETLILLEQGGIDHRQIPHLCDALADPALQDRLIPASRGMVLCRFRAHDKVFYTTRSTASVADHVANWMANAEENAIAQEIHLLYRDGDNFHLIQHPHVFQNMSQLMPTTAQQNETFLHANGQRITPEDLAYASAQRKQLATLNDYARVLILLWGLHDRSDLFAPTLIPKGANWLDPSFQQRYLRLVSQDHLITSTSRPTYDDFRHQQNRYLTAGATVAIRPASMLTYETAPGCFGPEAYDYSKHTYVRELVYRYDGPRVLIAQVHQSTNDGLYVTVPAVYAGYRTDVTRPSITARLRLNTRSQTAPENFLVLDRLHSADLDYYLTSRRERQSYAKYIELFQTARAHVRERDANEAPLRLALVRAVTEARLPHDPDRLPEHITDAMAIVRNTLRSGRIQPESPNHMTRALDALHAILASNSDRVAAVAALASALGREPLRFIIDGKAAFHAYFGALPSDADPRHPAHPWVFMARIQFHTDGSASLAESLSRTLLHTRTNEQIIHEWDGAKSAPSSARQRDPMAWDTLQFRLNLPADVPTDLQVIASQAFDVARDAVAATRPGRTIRIPRFLIPLGTTLGGTRVRLFCLSTDPLHLAHAWGCEGTRARVSALIQQRYANPERSLNRIQVDMALSTTFVHLRNIPKDANPFFTLLFDADTPYDPLTIRWGDASSGIDPERMALTNGDNTPLMLSTLNALGARLFPSLLPYCLAPSPAPRSAAKPVGASF